MTAVVSADPTAWTSNRPSVVRGPRPAGTLTLAEVGDPGQFAALVPVVQALTIGRRQAAVKLVHFGLVAVTADQIGLVGVDAPDFDAVWVGAADLEPADGRGTRFRSTRTRGRSPGPRSSSRSWLRRVRQVPSASGVSTSSSCRR